MPETARSLVLWTVYDHPKDYPDRYVARMFDVTAGKVRPTLATIMSSDLEWLRAALREMHLTRLERSPEDDPVVLETWI